MIYHKLFSFIKSAAEIVNKNNLRRAKSVGLQLVKKQVNTSINNAKKFGTVEGLN